MATKKTDHLRLGLFVLAGTLVLVAGLYLLGAKRGLFRSTIAVSAHFGQVSGLRAGNNVRYAGIDVGTVRSIRIVSDTAVLVTMDVRARDAGHIRNTAIASLGNDGLMGSKLVNLAPADGDGAPIVDGDHLRSSVPLDTELMLRTLDRTNTNMAAITDDLRTLSGRLNAPGGVAHLLGDTLLARQVRMALDDLGHSAAQLRSATGDVQDVMADVQAGRGAIGVLVGDPDAEQQVRGWLTSIGPLIDTLAQAAAQVDRFAEGLNAPGGLGHTLTRDTAVAGDVRRTLQQLERSSGLLEEDLRALQRNWFFRRYFREKEKGR
ncbi:MAG: MlaD family protein [Flavobacteriales bacterium]|jgi:phospholipid/cholesterol/gamma-HCH transport system substrate-binding protein|nr:MlaD family protein [Flavobacteriales bacterium]